MTKQSTNITLGRDLLAYQERTLFVVINFVVICTSICFYGIISNVINMIVFIKQGFQCTVNISFFGLAISDLCCLLSLQWISICLNPFFADSGAPWVAEEFQYLTAAWPHIISGRITSYITVYLSGERCLCILAPLKVKNIITPVRTTIAICLIYVLNILAVIPEYMTSYLQWKFFPDTNRTLLSLAFTKDRDAMFGIVFFLSFATGVTSFVSVIMLTAVLVFKLTQASHWRKGVTKNTDQNEAISNRDKKAVKLVILIAVLLIICFTPSAMVSMVTFVEPEFDLRKRYANTVISMWSISCIFQAVNSSSNILIYYNMSSKYRHTFHEIFRHFQITRN